MPISSSSKKKPYLVIFNNLFFIDELLTKTAFEALKEIYININYKKEVPNVFLGKKIETF